MSLTTFCKSQTVGPPSLRCIECSSAGDLKLTWIAPADPGAKFFSYEIFRANVFAGPYTSVGTVNTYTITSYNDLLAGGNTGSRYYFIKTHSGPTGTVISTSSDTVRSIYLNLSNPGDGTAFLVYNNLHQPKLSTSATQFKVYREKPPTWAQIKSTPALSYKDTISICNVFYNYQLQLTDASGCISTSNISGANFKDLIPPNLAVLDSVTVNSTGQSILGWKPSSSADCFGYVIYQYNGAAWQSIDTVFGINNTIYTYTSTAANGASVNYCIASMDSCGNISPLGAAHNTINVKTKYNVCARSTAINWNPYKNIPLGVSHYQVYCSTNAGPYLLLGSSTDTTFQHTGLTPGRTYCYMVRVFNTFGAITSSSNRSCLVATAPPSSSFVYLKSASVDLDQTVTVTLYCDTLVACKGFNVFKSEDGVTFNLIGFVTYNGKSTRTYNDADVSTSDKNYFYKAEVIDSCGNSRFVSNIGKTVLLKVKNDAEKIFNNNLSWDNYSTYGGGVAGYYVFRIINEVYDPNPVDFVPFGMTTYTDNVEDIVTESGKVGYVVTAVEGFGNIYGLIGASNSNKAEAYVEGKVFVPGAFAPKGVNRVWMPVAQFIEKTDYHVTVFDRWGKKVFETASDTEGWTGDGYEDNTYVYLVEYKNARGEFIEMKGTVTMVR
ncbi:MAG: gliding motility-associated C-terminal domain-containing protein [Sphingobacteriaceae bacterium]|nr:gliding motility-associated C-terminal domain-containing protein [Sphingobacteriaceae bacterium]